MSQEERPLHASAFRRQRYFYSPALETSLLWMLALSVEHKLPLVPMLDAFADDSPRHWKRGVRALSSRIHAGMSLPDALEATPGLLPADAVLAVRVGAESGILATALCSSAARSAARRQWRPTVLTHTFTYLFTLLGVMCCVVTFMMYYIVPKLNMIFQGFGTELPAATLRAVTLADVSVSYGIVYLPLLVIGVLAWPRFAALLTGRAPERYWNLDLFSALGRHSPGMMAADVVRSLATVAASGRPVSSAVATLSRHHYNSRVCRKLARVERDLEAGHDCWDSLLAAGLIRPSDAKLLYAAERAGNLPWALETLADRLERRFEFRVLALFELLRPAMVIGFGILVGFFVIAFFVPLIKLLNDLS